MNTQPADTAQRCRLKVGGMDCPSCENTVRSAVERMPGVRAVEADHLDMVLTIEGEGNAFDIEHIMEGIRSIGYHPREERQVKRTLLKVRDLDDPELEHLARRRLAEHGVSVLSADLDAGTLTLSHEMDQTELLGLMKRLGFSAKPLDGDATLERRRTLLERGAMALSTLTLLTAAVLKFNGAAPVYTISLFLLTIAVSGFNIYRKGLSAILRGRLDMNSLMSLSVTGAMIIGEWFEGATVMYLGAIAEYIEGWSVDRARNAVKRLLNLAPPSALVQRGGAEETIPVSEVRLGDHMVVRPGARIPLDGKVVSGASAVDQSPVTGESVPVSVETGHRVFAGSINSEGTLVVEATALMEDSTISRIIKMVQEAQSRRAPTERFIDRFAAVYTPAAVAAAALIALLPPLFLGDWAGWFYRALVLLVIACPCALVISTPVGIVSGLAAAARSGVLIKGGNYLERATHIDTVAFDKTGTLTRGKPAVHRVAVMNGFDETNLLRLSASLERYSEHPLAAAIVAESRSRGIELLEPSDVRSLPGRGAEGIVDGSMVRVGSHRMFEEMKLCPHENGCPISEIEKEGYTSVCISHGDRMIGYITLADSLRDESREAVARLHDLGIRTMMISGDNAAIAEVIGREVGIDEVRGQLMPADKLAILETRKADGERVMMIGDGINDAPALAAAEVGVAMGAVGTDVALETADVALMSDDVGKVPFTIAHARRTMALIRENIGISIGVKLLFVVLATFGWATLWMAVLADTGLSLLVTSNSLRLLKTRNV